MGWGKSLCKGLPTAHEASERLPQLLSAPCSDSLTCSQGDVTVEAALVDVVAGVVAAHDGRRGAVARLAAQPHAAVALGTVGLVRTLIACEGSR